mmetsp:Transcript_34707/g.88001  ORF Transcript_34707/g.88001 Transcript_34707/m.88001 type:complete len:309 (+) Transcript_34707:585-1511(+)
MFRSSGSASCAASYAAMAAFQFSISMYTAARRSRALTWPGLMASAASQSSSEPSNLRARKRAVARLVSSVSFTSAGSPPSLCSASVYCASASAKLPALKASLPMRLSRSSSLIWFRIWRELEWSGSSLRASLKCLSASSSWPMPYSALPRTHSSAGSCEPPGLRIHLADSETTCEAPRSGLARRHASICRHAMTRLCWQRSASAPKQRSASRAAAPPSCASADLPLRIRLSSSLRVAYSGARVAWALGKSAPASSCRRASLKRPSWSRHLATRACAFKVASSASDACASTSASAARCSMSSAAARLSR